MVDVRLVRKVEPIDIMLNEDAEIEVWVERLDGSEEYEIQAQIPLSSLVQELLEMCCVPTDPPYLHEDHDGEVNTFLLNLQDQVTRAAEEIRKLRTNRFDLKRERTAQLDIFEQE